MNSRQAWRNAVRDSELDVTAKVVAWTLDTYMDSHGDGWPSLALLAAGAGVDVRTVIRAVKRLELAGLIGVTRSRGRHANRYHATIQNRDTGVTVNGDRGVTRTLSEDASNPVTGVTRTRSTEQVIELGRRSRAEEPRAVADAYRRFSHTCHKVDVDPAMVELAHGWLRLP